MAHWTEIEPSFKMPETARLRSSEEKIKISKKLNDPTASKENWSFVRTFANGKKSY